MKDSLYFDQDALKRVISLLSDTRDSMTKIKEDLIQYNEANLKPYWSTAGSIMAQSRLEGFINQNVTDFINYISERINDLESSVPLVNQIDEEQ